MATKTSADRKATATRKAQAGNKPANAGPTIKVDLTAEAAQKALKRESARSRTVRLAEQYNGKPLADFKKAWESKALEIHGETSKFTVRQQPQAFSGWLSWLTRNGIVTVNSK